MNEKSSPIGELRIGYKKDNKLSRPEVVYVSHKVDWGDNNYCCYHPETNDPSVYDDNELLIFDYKLLRKLQDEWDLQDNLDRYKSSMKEFLKHEEE